MSNKIIFHKSHKLLIKRKAELKSIAVENDGDFKGKTVEFI